MQRLPLLLDSVRATLAGAHAVPGKAHEGLESAGQLASEASEQAKGQGGA